MLRSPFHSHLNSGFRDCDHVDEGALLGRVDGAAVRAIHTRGEAHDAATRRRELPLNGEWS